MITVKIANICCMVLDLKVNSLQRLSRAVQVAHPEHRLIIYHLAISSTDGHFTHNAQVAVDAHRIIAPSVLEMRYRLRIGNKSIQ